MRTFRIVMLGAIGCALAGVAEAQVVREDDASSVAGRLDLMADPADQDAYTFRSNGGEILFADIDATIYERVAGTGGHDELISVTQEGEDGCGGAALVCLEVLDSGGAVVCSADRPTQPGWQRDPALFCPLEEPGNYTLVVKACDTEHETEAPVDEVAYLLSVSLRGEAPEGTLSRAVARSRNNLP